ncbi:MAG TPA: TonB-dependent receptor [Blastocatellia bacterium]|nr:TonB-dependent receptor [Blastocatellia bacterium]
MKHLRKISVWFTTLLLCATGFAQTYQGRILGTATDSGGGVVKGVKVTITNAGTGVARTLETNESGDYAAPNLAPGIYRITAEAPGFKRVEINSVRLEVAKDIRIDLEMVPGAVSEAVTVTGEAPVIETTNNTLGGTFSNQVINDLPLNGRDFQNLVVLRPGIQRSTGGGFLSISSNGNRPENNNFIVDGTDNNDPYYGTTVINAEGVQGTPGTILPIDAIQEFNAQQNPPAEYGWKPGAIINLGLKSGTNELHGTLYYFHRNSALDARNFFNTEPDPKKALRQHQFGGSFGGPIRRGKTFYFGSYEGVRGFVSNSNLVTVPAAVPLGGDPENSIPDAIASLESRGIPLNPLSANLIGIGSFSGNGTFPGLFPLNDGTNPAGPSQLNLGFPNNNRMDNFIIKIDHNVNENNNLSGRYFYGDSLQTEQDIAVLRPEWRSQSDLNAQVVGVNWVWTPSPQWVNEAKFGYNRFWQAITTADHTLNPSDTYGINPGVTQEVNFGMPTILIGGFTQLGGNSGWPLLTTPNQTWQFVDNVSYNVGKHTYRFGAEVRHGTTDNLRNRRGKGRIRFQNGGNAHATSTPLEDFLAGIPDRGDIFVGDSRRQVSINSFGAFIQDDWRISPRLTINYGVRYDLSGVIKEKNDLIGNFDPEVGLQQVGVNIDAPYNGDHNNFAPRFGIVWDPWGKGRTVIRAGAGVAYEIPILALFLGQNGVNNATTPGLNSIPTGAIGSNIAGTIVAAATTQSSGLRWTAAGPIFNVDANCDPNRGGTPCDILGVDRDLRTPYVTNWTVNVQQALWKDAAVQIAYVGNKGSKLYGIRDINQVDPDSQAEEDCGHCEQAGRPFNSRFPFLGYINFIENSYNSLYNGLQLTMTQRTYKGLNYVLGYTWSHSIDYASLQRAAQPQNSFNQRAERASSDLDIRHRFTLALTYDLPNVRSPWQLLENWQVNSIVTVQTGPPYNAIDFGNDFSLTGEFSDRWDLIGDPSSIPNFSTTGPIPFERVLAPPAPGTFGNAGRNIFRAPGYRNWDFSLVKTWRPTETVGVQFRAEFFNILNHPNFANPAILFTNDLSFPESFGLVTATPDVAGANPVIGSGGPRNIQFGLKIRF